MKNLKPEIMSIAVTMKTVSFNTVYYLVMFETQAGKYSCVNFISSVEKNNK